MIVRQIAVGTVANFVYLLVDERTREGAVVDSGWETEPIARAVEEAGATVRYAIATHEHFDHTSTLRDVAEKLSARVVAHESSPIDCDMRVSDGQTLRLGEIRLRVLHTPGHTKDSISVYGGGSVFTGDTLFVGTIGRFEREDAPALYQSLYKVLLELPASTTLYPGHDYGEVPARSLGEERASNPYLMAGDLRSFLSLFS